MQKEPVHTIDKSPVEKHVAEPVSQAQKPNAPKAKMHKVVVRSFFDVINGNILINRASLKQAPFVLFLTGVALVYIANTYFAERKIRQINKISNELKELRSEFITSKSQLMFVSKQSEVAKTAEMMGLQIQESTTPPGKIIFNHSEKQK